MCQVSTWVGSSWARRNEPSTTRMRRGETAGAVTVPLSRPGVDAAVEHGRQVVDVDGEHELDAGAVGLAPGRTPDGVAVGRRACPPGHALGEAHAGPVAAHEGRERGRGAAVEVPLLLGHEQGRGPLAEGRDGEQGVDRQGPGHDGAVGDEQVLVHLVARAGEHPAAVVDHPVGAVVGHGAAAERVHRDERLAQHGRPQRVGDVLAAGGRAGPPQHIGVVVEDGQVADGGQSTFTSSPSRHRRPSPTSSLMTR